MRAAGQTSAAGTAPGPRCRSCTWPVRGSASVNVEMPGTSRRLCKKFVNAVSLTISPWASRCCSRCSITIRQILRLRGAMRARRVDSIAGHASSSTSTAGTALHAAASASAAARQNARQSRSIRSWATRRAVADNPGRAAYALRRAGLQHAEQRDYQVGRTIETDADRRTAADAAVCEVIRQSSVVPFKLQHRSASRRCRLSAIACGCCRACSAMRSRTRCDANLAPRRVSRSRARVRARRRRATGSSRVKRSGVGRHFVEPGRRSARRSRRSCRASNNRAS